MIVAFRLYSPLTLLTFVLLTHSVTAIDVTRITLVHSRPDTIYNGVHFWAKSDTTFIWLSDSLSRGYSQSRDENYQLFDARSGAFSIVWPKFGLYQVLDKEGIWKQDTLASLSETDMLTGLNRVARDFSLTITKTSAIDTVGIYVCRRYEFTWHDHRRDRVTKIDVSVSEVHSISIKLFYRALYSTRFYQSGLEDLDSLLSTVDGIPIRELPQAAIPVVSTIVDISKQSVDSSFFLVPKDYEMYR